MDDQDLYLDTRADAFEDAKAEAMYVSELERTITALQAQVAELEKDRERLDWMNEHDAAICSDRGKSDVSWVAYYHRLGNGDTVYRCTDAKADFRDAIDEAMNND